MIVTVGLSVLEGACARLHNALSNLKDRKVSLDLRTSDLGHGASQGCSACMLTGPVGANEHIKQMDSEYHVCN